MKKLVLIILSIFAVSSFIHAQQSSVKMETVESDSKDFSEGRSLIKLNPLLFFRGDFPIYFETSVSDKIAVEAGVGFTLIDYFSQPLNLINYDYDYEEENGLGYSFRLGLRYYASDYSYMQEGFYFGANVRYQLYKAEFTSIENIDYSANNDIKNLDFRLHVGYLHMWEENFFIEPYAAFGLRRKTAVSEINYDQNTQTFSTPVGTQMKPILSLGFKFGISF